MMKLYKFKMIKKLFTSIVIVAISPIATLANPNNSLHNQSAIYTKNAPTPIGAYSQAIKVGDTIYISGQIPIDSKSEQLVTGDFKKQFRQAITNLAEIAKAAGGSLNDIVKVTVYVTDLINYTALNQVMAEYFHKPYPARVVVEIKSLPKHAAVEIEAVMEMRKEV